MEGRLAFEFTMVRGVSISVILVAHINHIYRMAEGAITLSHRIVCWGRQIKFAFAWRSELVRSRLLSC